MYNQHEAERKLEKVSYLYLGQRLCVGGDEDIRIVGALKFVLADIVLDGHLLAFSCSNAAFAGVHRNPAAQHVVRGEVDLQVSKQNACLEASPES